MEDHSIPDHTGNLSFGRYLKAVRRSQGISLAVVASEIRVSPGLLTWIEAEDFERMPEDVYTRGILRAYARALDVDPDDIVGRYNASRAAYIEGVRQEAEILGSGSRTFSRMSLALGVLVLIIAGSLYFYGDRAPDNAASRAGPAAGRQVTQKFEGQAGSETVVPQREPGREGGPNVPPSGANRQAGRQVLLIDAVSEVTINIRVDDGPYTKYHLDPNDHMELAGQSHFHILISDAAGARLRFNGEPVRIPAEPGHSVNFMLPKRFGDR